MPTFTIQTPEGKKLTIQAATEADAMRGAQEWSASQGQKKKSLWAPGEVKFLPPAGMMANFNRGAGILDEVQAGIATVGDVVSGKARGKNGLVMPGDVSNAFNRNISMVRRSEDQFTKDHPNAAALARGTGSAATVAIPTGQTAQLFAQAPRMVNAARGAVSAGLQGAAFAATDRGTASERLNAAGKAAIDPLTLALGAAGGAIAPARRSAPKPVTNDVKLLVKEGVQLTPGQANGGLAKSIEDASTSLPIVGDAIQSARGRGIEDLNRAVINRSLKPIGGKLPDDIAPGYDAIKYAGDKLSEGYAAAIPRRTVRADPAFTESVAGTVLPVVETLRPESKAQLEKIIESRLTSRLGPDGQMTGEVYQRVQSELGSLSSRFNGATDPDARAIGEALQGVSAALKDAASRQDPSFAAKMKALDAGWANLVRAEEAAKVGTIDGVFTAPQYAAAVRSSDKSVRRRGYSRGEALGQDLSSAAKNVLPSRIPDSGTPRRLLSSAGAMAIGGGGAMLGGPTGLAMTGAAMAGGAAAYSPKAVAAFNRALSAKIDSQDARIALVELQNLAANDPGARRLYQEAAARLSRVAGAQGGVDNSGASRQMQPAVSMTGNP